MDFEELMFCAVAVVVVVLLLTCHLPVYPELVLNLWASYLGLLKLKSTSHHTWLVLLFLDVFTYLFVLMEVWSSEDSLEESILSLHHVEQTRVTKLSGKGLKALSHLAGPMFCF